MPKLFNTVTKKYDMVPASYAGKFPYEAVEEEVVEVVTLVTEKVLDKPKKKKAEYNPAAIDADGDGLVQDGTIFERPLTAEELAEREAQALQAAEEQAQREAEAQALADLKASAKAKLIAGEPLTEEEASTLIF